MASLGRRAGWAARGTSWPAGEAATRRHRGSSDSEGDLGGLLSFRRALLARPVRSAQLASGLCRRPVQGVECRVASASDSCCFGVRVQHCHLHGVGAPVRAADGARHRRVPTLLANVSLYSATCCILCPATEGASAVGSAPHYCLAPCLLAPPQPGVPPRSCRPTHVPGPIHLLGRSPTGALLWCRFSSNPGIAAGIAGSLITRYAAREAFGKHKRSTTTTEIIAELGSR